MADGRTFTNTSQPNVGQDFSMNAKIPSVPNGRAFNPQLPPGPPIPRPMGQPEPNRYLPPAQGFGGYPNAAPQQSAAYHQQPVPPTSYNQAPPRQPTSYNQAPPRPPNSVPPYQAHNVGMVRPGLPPPGQQYPLPPPVQNGVTPPLQGPYPPQRSPMPLQMNSPSPNVYQQQFPEAQHPGAGGGAGQPLPPGPGMPPTNSRPMMYPPSSTPPINNLPPSSRQHPVQPPSSTPPINNLPPAATLQPQHSIASSVAQPQSPYYYNQTQTSNGMAQTSQLRPPMPPTTNQSQTPGGYQYSNPPVGQNTVPPGVQNKQLPYPSPSGGYPTPTAGYPNNYVTSGPTAFTSPNQLAQGVNRLSLHGVQSLDLLQNRNILPPKPVDAPKVILVNQDPSTNCSPDIFRCTLTKIPESNNVLQKCRLPLGIVLHPFKDIHNLPVIQCNTIVRCRTCRTYINPFVYFVDQRRWKCNLCFRVNDLPDEFLYDPVSKSYGDPSRRPEIKSATIEFIAPGEYMVRPPQPAVYLFLMDVSAAATETGYLKVACDIIMENLSNLPGDSRTQVGFITYDSSVYFYNLAEGLSQPQMMVVSDIEDVFLPCPDNLLANLQESRELIQDLLQQLPIKFMDNHNPDSALGAALTAAYKLMVPTGGRITILQASLPIVGPGALSSREDPNQRAAKEVTNLGPSTDFYKKMALDCSSQQIAVDLFLLSTQYADLATLSCISKFSGGGIHYYPEFQNPTNALQTEKFERDFQRYLTRKIGFEAVMRIRCTRGLSIHTFHGNFFVRSTDLLSLPNINPDAGFGMQLAIEENLSDLQTACFQAALLYTSSKGERRIRVHTMCLPVTNIALDIINGADQQAIVSLLAKMAADRSLSSSLVDAREALINAATDAFAAYKNQEASTCVGVLSPPSLKLLPLYILALLKNMAFRVGLSTKLDQRVFSMCQMKTLPLSYLMLYIYPSLYAVHALNDQNAIEFEEKIVPQPDLLNLSSEKIDSHGAYLLDTGEKIILYVCRGISDTFCRNVLNVSCFNMIPESMIDLPELETEESDRLRNLVDYLQSQRPSACSFQVIRDDQRRRELFLQHLVDDRSESSYSYYEFLQHLRQVIHK